MTEAGIQESVREAEAYKSPYELWKEAEGLPTIRGYFVQNLYTLALTPWRSRGGAGAFINLEGTGGFNDTYVYELGPRESSAPIKHIYEETVFILKGQGATTVWIDERKKQTFEWRERSYFAIPPNASHQFHNLSGSELMRYIAMTAAPRVIDTFKSHEFVFNNPFVFEDRFNGEDGYFQESQRGPGHNWPTNFVADVLASTPEANDPNAKSLRGAGTTATVFAMVNSTVRSHSQAWPVGTHSKFHRHGPGIHVVLLRGEGYSLLWPDGAPMERIGWRPGSMFVPPEGWWHAHFNTGREPSLFLAIGWGSDKPKAGGTSYVYKSVKDGGDQYEYEDEDPAVHREFEEALRRNGVTCAMGRFHPYCTQR